MKSIRNILWLYIYLCYTFYRRKVLKVSLNNWLHIYIPFFYLDKLNSWIILAFHRVFQFWLITFWKHFHHKIFNFTFYLRHESILYFTLCYTYTLTGTAFILWSKMVKNHGHKLISSFISKREIINIVQYEQDFYFS